MFKKVKTAGDGFLTRLHKDETGNILILAAASILPLTAVVGGAIDISRLYAVKTRLQTACDAGALSGRKVMGNSTWNDAAKLSANKMFTANFADDFFGIDNLRKTFTGNQNVVNGEVSADVPLTVMQIFGASNSTVAVKCTSEFRIPNTDVMFVLDTTGSMNCAPSDNPCTGNGGVEKTDSRMAGLRKSVNCFFESLAKLDTGELCNSAGDPAATGISSEIQLRIGFLPYSSNVNVGKLLPTSYFSDTWDYQSRVPIISNEFVWRDTSNERFGNYVASTPATRPTTTTYNNRVRNSGNYNNWGDISGTGSEIIVQVGKANTTLDRVKTAANATACTAFNTVGTGMADVGDVAGGFASDVPGTSSSPVYASATTGIRTRPNVGTVIHSVRGYRYNYNSSFVCRLQTATGKTGSTETRWTQTRTRTGTFDIAWSSFRHLTGWTNKQRTGTEAINFSALKNGTDEWHDSFSITDFTHDSETVRFSGNNFSSDVYTSAPLTVNWEGCIEERNTYKNIDDNPDDEWAPIPSMALDMNIDLAPSSTAGSKWGPALEQVVFGRYSNGSTRTTSNTTSSPTSMDSRLDTLSCPTEARKLESYKVGDTLRTPVNIKTYTASLRPKGATYHDIGLLWGARLMSPTGIFGTYNSNDSSGKKITIQRHMVFMTDGDTGTCSSSYSPYGVAWWDRRQTNKSDPSDNTGASTCINSYTNRIVDARTAALCNAIKNKNITLWVVSFGAGVNAISEARLKACASSVSHFYDADSTDDLVKSFKEIALQISRLRLQV